MQPSGWMLQGPYFEMPFGSFRYLSPHSVCLSRSLIIFETLKYQVKKNTFNLIKYTFHVYPAQYA